MLDGRVHCSDFDPVLLKVIFFPGLCALFCRHLMFLFIYLVYFIYFMYLFICEFDR